MTFIRSIFSISFLTLALASCSDNKVSDQLIMAARDGDLAQAQQLLRAGADIDACGSWEGCDTAIVVAAEKGNVGMVKLLAENGASLNKHDPTPLYVAASSEHPEVVQYLLQHGATLGGDNHAVQMLRSKLQHEHSQAMLKLLSLDN